MTKLLSRSHASLGSAKPVVELTTTGTSTWPEWDRFLAIDGVPAMHIGNICGTCSFFFERLDGASKPSIDILRTDLAGGLVDIHPATVERFGALLPEGRYALALIERPHVRVEQGTADDYFVRDKQDPYDDPMEPNTHYYRLNERSAVDLGKDQYGDSNLGFEFIIPLAQPVDAATISSYRERIDAGVRPTAISLSVLDIKQPSNGDTHWCMAHYLLDGHHKVEAAAQAQKPVTLLAFLPLEGGICREEDLLHFLSAYPT